MYFSLQYWIDNILPSHEQEIVLNYGGNHHITCTLRKASEHEKKHHHHEDFVVCIVNSKVEPKDKIVAMFESIAQRRLPPGSKDPETWLKSPERKSAQVDFMDADGLIKSNVPPPLEILPLALQSFIEQVRTELQDYAVRTVRIIRWRLNLSGSHNPLREHKGFCWSFDNQCWYDAPGVIHWHIEMAVLASPRYMSIKVRQKSEINETLNKIPISRQKVGRIRSESEGKTTRSGYDKWAPSRARSVLATARDDGKGESLASPGPIVARQPMNQPIR